MNVTLEEVDRIASLSMLKLNEKKREQMQQNLNEILEHAQKLNELDTNNVAPTTYILKQQNILRDDIPQKMLARQELLSNAPEHFDGYFAVPKVVE